MNLFYHYSNKFKDDLVKKTIVCIEIIINGVKNGSTT